MKKTLLFFVILFFSIAPQAFAQGFVPLAPIPGLTESGVANSGNLAAFFNNLYKYMIGLAAALAVIMITWAGIKIALNRDNVSTIMDSKGNIANALFGLVLVLSPVIVFSIINPNILNLSLNLPPLTGVSESPSFQVQQQDASTPYTIGSGTACNGVINIGGTCTQTIFAEDTYASRPVGAWCYDLATPDNGKPYNCYRTQDNCRAACRTSCGSWLSRIGCPNPPDNTCNDACVVGI